MVNSKRIKKMLAGVLCASLVFQTVGSTYANEGENQAKIETENSTEEAEPEVIDFDELMSEAKDETSTEVEGAAKSEAESISVKDDDKTEESVEEELITAIVEDNVMEDVSTEVAENEDGESDETETVQIIKSTSETEIDTEEETDVVIIRENGDGPDLVDDGKYSFDIVAYNKVDNLNGNVTIKLKGNYSDYKFNEDKDKYRFNFVCGGVDQDLTLKNVKTGTDYLLLELDSTSIVDDIADKEWTVSVIKKIGADLDNPDELKVIAKNTGLEFKNGTEPIRVEDDYMKFNLSTYNKYDNTQGSLYIKVTGGYSKYNFNDDDFKYIVVDAENQESGEKYLSFEQFNNYDGYGILKLRKNNDLAVSKTWKISVIHVEENEDEPYIYRTIAKNENVNIFSGLLFVGYNNTEGNLEYKFTHDIELADSVSDKSVVDADGRVINPSENGKYVLENDSSYYFRYTINGEQLTKQITMGNYLEKIKVSYRPVKILLYHPYESQRCYEYLVDSEEKLVFENAVSYYYFSEYLINSKEAKTKDYVYDVHVIDTRNVDTVYANVVLKEKKWDKSFEFEVLDGEMKDKDNPKKLILYYNNTNFDNANLIIKNAKMLPTIPEDDNGVVKIGNIEEDANNNGYKVNIKALATGKTSIVVSVGDESVMFNIEVKPYEKISGINFVSEEYKNVNIQGIGKKGYTIIKIDPRLAIGSPEKLIKEVVDGDGKPSDIITIEEEVDLGDIQDSENDTPWNQKKIIFKANKIGKAYINIGFGTSIDKTIQCEVNVTNAAFSDTEIKNLVRSVGTLYAVTNVDGDSLYNVELPAGWEWIDNSPYIAVEDSTTIKYYDARYTQEGYAPCEVALPVATTEVIGVSISGDSEITAAHEGKYKINLQLRGYDVDFESNRAFANALKKIVKCTWQADSMLKVKSPVDEWEFKVEAGSTDSKTEGLVKVHVVIGDESIDDDFPVMVLTEHINNLQIKPIAAMIRPLKFTYDESEKIVFVQQDKLTASTNMLHFEAIAKIDKVEKPITKGVISWSINDESVGSLSEEEDGSVYVRILKPGTVVLTATANDVGSNSVSIPIEIRDFTPIMETYKLSINKYAEDGVVIPIHAVEGNPITSVFFDDKSVFKVENVNGKFVMKLFKPEEIIETKTVVANIKVRTRMSDNLFEDVEITIDCTKPDLNLQIVEPANLFYVNAKAVYKVDSNLEVTSIKNTRTRTKGFSVAGYDSSTKTLTITANGLTSANVDEFGKTGTEICNIPVTIRCKGFGEYTDTIKVVPVNTKPNLYVKAINTVVTEMINDSYIYENTSDNVCDLNNVDVQCLTEGVDVIKSVNGIKVKYEGTKNKNYKLFLSSSSWTSTMNVTGKISIVDNLQTVLGVNEIKLNLAHTMSANGAVEVPVSIKNNISDISSVSITGADKKSRAIIENGYLDLRYNATSRCIEAGLNNSAAVNVKPGEYNYKVSAKITRGIEAKNAKLKVTVVANSKKPAVKLTAKGSINLVNRQDTAITYSVKIANMTTAIKEISLAGTYSGYFTAILSDDCKKITVKANPEITMNTATSYPLEIKCLCENNVETSTIVKINPKNTLPKLKQSIKKGVIYKIADNSVSWTVENSSFGQIESITPADTKTNKLFSIKGNGKNVTVKLADDSKRTIKKKDYKVKYEVKFKDAATNSKPAVLEMTIKVK